MATDLYSGPDIPANPNTGDVITYTGISMREIAGRSGVDNEGNSTAERTWLVKGSSNPLTCRTALEDGPVTINTYDDLFIESLSHEMHGPQEWLFTASYNAKIPDVGSYTVSIDTTGATVLQTYGYAQTAYAAPGQTATNFGTAIDVQDGKPQGIQRVVPAMKLNIRAKIAGAYVTTPLAYSKLVNAMTGYTNNAAFLTYAAGELLFLGGVGDIVGDNPELTFSFLASPNVTGLTVGSITNISKQGHEYIWFNYFENMDGTTSRLISDIRAAYVGRVYGAADFSTMKIGDAAP